MSVRNVLGFVFKIALVSLVMMTTMVVVSELVLPAETVENAPQQAGSVLLLLLIVNVIDALIVCLVITQSRWRGLPLMAGLTFAFYGVQTVVGQIEAIVFLTPLGERWGAGSIPVLTMPIDFILSQFYIGAALSIVGVPVAVLLFGKAKGERTEPLFPRFGAVQWLWKLGAIIVMYELLYFGFGYYVAWKAPAVQAFYQGADPGSFIAQMRNVASETPTLIPFQALRALLWTAFAFPVISMLRHKSWLGALLTGLLLSIPMNIPHIVPNPYMPPAVRGVHFIETASSTFIFGMLMFGLLYRAHRLAPDLFGILPSRKGLTIEQLCDRDS